MSDQPRLATIAGVVLGGRVPHGGSGRWKQLAELDGRPLLQYAVDAMLAVPLIEPKVVVLGSEAEQIRRTVELGGTRTVVSTGWREGMAASLRAGIEAVADRDWVIVTLGDQPGIGPEIVELVARRAVEANPGTVALRATYRGVPGHPVALSRKLFDRVATLAGDRGARDLLSAAPVELLEVGTLGELDDVDTPEQLDALRQSRSGRAMALASRGEAVAMRLTKLVQTLRSLDVRVGTGELVTAHRALAAIDVSSPDQAYVALRAVLCARHEDFAAFDAAFVSTFLAGGDRRPESHDTAQTTQAGLGANGKADGEGVGEAEAGCSDVEILRQRDFAEYTDEERAQARVVLQHLARRGPRRRSRRTRPTRRNGTAPDLRRTVRASLRRQGEPLDRYWRTQTVKRRPLVLVCDLSGSMEPYARMLLQYLHAIVSARPRVEVFAFATRLTRITRELRRSDSDRALARVTAAGTDWSGGTRMGEALAGLNREQGGRLHGAVVVILSDGWDCGDPELLDREMAWLHRSAHSVIWLNPLKARTGYEPLARGMSVALPHVDHFVAGHSLASIEELTELLDSSR